jgi:hypothetical protein
MLSITIHLGERLAARYKVLPRKGSAETKFPVAVLA